MTVKEAQYKLNSLRNRYLLLKGIESILLSTGLALLAYTVTSFVFYSSFSKILVASLTFILVLLARILVKHLHQINRETIVQFVNAQYQNLQESSDLLLQEDETLNALQRLQKERVLSQFEKLYPSIKLPHRIGQAALVFIAGTVIYVTLSGFATTFQKEHPLEINDSNQIKSKTDPNAIFIESLEIKVTPPSYTGMAPFFPKNFSLAIPEGSTVSWRANFSGNAINPKLIFAGRDSVRMQRKEDKSFASTQKIYSTGFYQLQWSDQTKTHQSDYYKIDAIKDQPPKVQITNLSQFTQLRYTDKLDIDVTSTLNDDYGLVDARIIATVSKGSGEGVKFREEVIPFNSPREISGKRVQAKASFNLKKLGLEPGDELYFYVDATDNKAPVANRNRTETFFISLKDTASYAMVSDEGLGVDLMPEYFRSQRQIIIDTEKLLKQQKQKQVTKQQFNSTSNELGYDQKVLRLRYGQFLGEEEDSGIPHGHEDEGNVDDDGKEKDPTKDLTHQHDTKNEHNLVADKKDDHKKVEGMVDEKEEDPLKAFVHEHDNQEEATFFLVSTRTKLKMALSIMWDAELHLRLFDPAKSLPYQYKALNLLKEISNDSRIYVHRMGFDPPPLKEERRLTADLTEIKNSTSQYSVIEETKLDGVRAALRLTESLITKGESNLTDENKGTLSRAGNEIASIIVNEPGTSLKSLSLIRNLIDGGLDSEKTKSTLIALRKELWDILPKEAPAAGKQSGAAHQLDNKFLQQLEILKHE